MKKSDPDNEPVNIAAADAFFEIFGFVRVDKEKAPEGGAEALQIMQGSGN